MSTVKHYPRSTFRLLSEDELKLVWQWRNKATIRANMHHDQLISWEQHQAWFKQLNTTGTVFFVMWQNERPIGALYFQPHSDTGLEWGCYLGETDVWPGSGLLLEIAALDYAALQSHCNTLHAEVLSFNHSVLKLHQLFGYQETAITPAASKRNGVHYQVHHFCYATADWQSNRATILAKLPKQIANAATFIEFFN
ncbi:UDP-4-amino-4,6-dideoxy-N-acetyl-beta-L-altrosamine N-acetyltransferase [Alkalimonas amylolytica]|uniref:UDP-4-amino-4,6-dideoxy-N-acetyl-beta-L-altrosamine N-acetyltransferase n=1 Tax=Alkalimonas amylolytica TaxID=152573 RepID=A0A1H4B7F1_ALKAM|nr:UDP-4-amino-4,6-dideoxy-N-acetyl-beta-L-altrosamine N-acetyltransferase [Alkalimonas amylolytica]SEA44185.1 UDP-4-amino-4,6-dideoxy-N-acetyl-beta-L-altrosamine N-acetyltransferase [Alkalimonas amylolytica]